MSASFNQMISSLQTQRDLRKNLVDDIAHELNTPLSVIRLEAKGLRDQITSPNHAADQIIEEVDRLSSLVYDLNLLAETDSDAFRLNLEAQAIDQTLEAEVERWQLRAQLADIKLELLPLPSDLPTIRIDAVRLSQVLGNLIKNGLQYTSVGGRVTVRCSLEKKSVVVSVCDTGSGIAPEDLPHVFERFYRADSSHQNGKGGQGLGLSIVKQIMEAHNGEVWAESEIGNGSCFYFRLPA
jgi:signal transduction histidine kinase